MQATSHEAAAPPIITFDKDDEDTLDFVAASANLRSIIFGIETKSRFDIKQMAGNIIPAIATTNAIVAGLCVLQSFKVLRGEFTNTKEVGRLLSGLCMHLSIVFDMSPLCACPHVFSAYLVASRPSHLDLADWFARSSCHHSPRNVCWLTRKRVRRTLTALFAV